MRVAGFSQLHLFRRGHKPEIAPAASEFRTAVAFADTLRRSARSNWQWVHFPAGEFRETVTGERLKRQGMKPGWPDYLFISPEGQLHCLELKRKRGGRLTDPQKDFRDWCHKHKVPWKLANTYDAAIAAVSEWGVLKHEVRPQ
jgi:hypothetical protein